MAVRLRKAPSAPSLLSIFIMKGMLHLFKIFSCTWEPLAAFLYPNSRQDQSERGVAAGRWRRVKRRARPNPVLPRWSPNTLSRRHRSPARSPRAGGGRSAAAARASSNHRAAPGPEGASRLSGANCQGSKPRVRRVPRGHRRGRARARVAVRVGLACRTSWGTLVNQA